MPISQSSPRPRDPRSVQQRWSAGPPTTINQWVPYATKDRQTWLDCAREHSTQTPATNDDPGTTYEVDGRHITDKPALYCALGEAVNGPGGYFGGNLDALADCLSGGFGATVPFTLAWNDIDAARRGLAGIRSAEGESYFDLVLRALTDGGVTVEER